MDSGYMIGEYKDEMLCYDDRGSFYIGGSGNSNEKSFYEEDSGFFARHVISVLGCGSLYYCMPVVAWNYIIDSNVLKKLITDFNAGIKSEETDFVYHRMFTDALDKISDGPWYLIYEDYS